MAEARETYGMFDSLPYRNDAAIVHAAADPVHFPQRKRYHRYSPHVDKGLPAMMMALAGLQTLHQVYLFPVESTLPPHRLGKTPVKCKR